MKKVLSVIAIAALSVAFVSCGPSEAEKAEQAKQDSIKAAEIANALLGPLTSAIDSAATTVVDSTATAVEATTTETK
ncbi:MAG: hypothetical protein Q8M29_16225 [Bacteroidota bacterium]|nr:hypothetical protein [Bacteroidota bacterium]